jgi:pimeloyl-ACP methyl ester carboxylesterase
VSEFHLIYIPGLGDNYDQSRQTALHLWRLFGVTTELVPMQWYDGRPYDEKQERIQAAINAAISQGKKVSLIGESAGASIALNVFSKDPRVHRFVAVCGVVDSNADVSPKIYARSPAFKTSMQLLGQSVERLGPKRADISIITSLRDPVVNQKRNVLKDVRLIQVLAFGHFTAICLCLTVFSTIVINQATQSKAS